MSTPNLYINTDHTEISFNKDKTVITIKTDQNFLTIYTKTANITNDKSATVKNDAAAITDSDDSQDDENDDWTDDETDIDDEEPANKDPFIKLTKLIRELKLVDQYPIEYDDVIDLITDVEYL
jgi:hypothetical protein